MKNKFIYFIGPDGSGKTTILKKIINDYKKSFRHEWIRSPKIISKPLMLICRLIGLTKYKKIGNIKYGSHNFEKSKIVSLIFPYLQLLDFIIVWNLKKIFIMKNEIIIFDRFCIDTLADLMVSTKRMDLHKSWVGKEFIKLLPKKIIIMNLNVKESNIKKRKIDTKFDQSINQKIKIYKILCEYLKIKTFDNNSDLDVSYSNIKKYIDDKLS